MASKVEKVVEDIPQERFVPPADKAAPKDPDAHTRWVRDTPRRIEQLKRQGYQTATKEDVPGLGRGWDDGEVIRDGDLVLMKTGREGVEERELDRRRTGEEQERKQRQTFDQMAGMEDNADARDSSRRGKMYAVGIDLKG